MKRMAIILSVACACAGIGWATFRAAAPSSAPLSKYVPAGPLVYLEAKDFSSLLSDWNSSSQKQEWIRSSSYEVFSRSRLFLRLKGAGDQFAAAAGLPPDMNFLSQMSGERSALALYDIGNLQFLYITYLSSARSMQTMLWQTRAKFEPRNAGGVEFYLRRDPASQREVAFAVSGDYLLLATREDLMAGALQLMAGQPGRTVENEPWWMQSTSAAGSAGDLRLVLDMEKLVPNGYFRTYWVQQNITELSQYSAAISDLYRSPTEYRDERVLIRKKEPQAAAAGGFAAAAELTRLVPEDAGLYVATANPSADDCLALLETKLLAPHVGPAPLAKLAPEVQLTSGEQGGGSDLETRMDQAAERPSTAQSTSALKELLKAMPVLASLQVQSTSRDQSGVFVRLHSAVVLKAASDWNQSGVEAAVSEFVAPTFTAGQFGLAWQEKAGFFELDGLWPLALAVRGQYVVVSDDPALMETVLANFSHKSDNKPAQLLAGFNHQRERSNFLRFTGLLDHSGVVVPAQHGSQHEPQFFSENMASLSRTLAGVSAERIEVRSEEGKVRQTVTYEWSP